MNKRTLKNDFLELEYLTASLRISGLTPKGKGNLFADLSGEPPIATSYGDFYFRGGHRLWHAPEAMPRTYAPDTGELKITDLPDGVILETNTEPGTGIRKRIEIRLAVDAPTVRLTHTLINDGMWSVELAPWAITQFKAGGVAILPQSREQTDLLPNRSLVLWSYTDIASPHVTWGNEYILVYAGMDAPFKIGFPNPRGWLAYWLDGTLFVKRAVYDPQAEYYDFGSSSECYCNDRFLELETLAPVGQLDPGASVIHNEVWELYAEVVRPADETAVQRMIKNLGLG